MLTTSVNSAVKPEQLRFAAQIVEDHLKQDNFPDLQELLQGEAQHRSQATLNTDSASQWNFLKLESFKNLPDFMLQQYDSLQVSSFMGIFPEINRVWMTIDNHLYLWNYDAPDGLGELINTFEDPDQVIVNVSLVKPIPGVFLEQIEYLLVVSTPLEITLLGIAFSEPKKGNLPRSSLTIYKTDMSCYADGVNMSSIVGTRKGRIFMRGNDGQLFELSQDGWLTRKIRKINKSASAIAVFIPSIFNWAGSDPIRMITLDDERNLLYTVTKRNHVELISLGEDGTEFNHIAKISDLADQLLRFSAFDDFITSIHPTACTESNVIHCVAITSSGHRVYFSTNPYTTHHSTLPGQKKYVAPTTLQLKYVLAPPPIFGTLPQQGSKIHESYYFNGLTVAAQAMDDLDRVLVFAPHPGSILQSPLKSMSEYASFFDVEGRTWAIAESPNDQIQSMRNEQLNKGMFLNELASQFDYESRKIFLLTNGGLTTISKLRPLDLFLKLINNTPNGDSRAYQEFFTCFGPSQCCAMSLAIACCHPSISAGQFGIPQNICNVASKVYFELGGAPTFNVNQSISGMGIGNATMGIPLSTKEMVFSPKHNGLALYISRILRPIWKKNLTELKTTPSGSIVFDASFLVEELVSVQLKLQGLDRFLKQYPKLIAPPSPDTRPTQGDHEAWKSEQQSFANLYELILRSIEAIAFLSILIDFRFSSITQGLSEANQKELGGMNFEMLVTTPKGKEIAKSLMSALVNNHINKELGVESIILSLQQRCSSICESNDVVLYKGLEHLQNAKSIGNQGSAGQHLQESLRLFLSISKQISMEKLHDIVENFKSLRFFQGVVDLALKKAADIGAEEIFTNPLNAINSKVDDLNQLRIQCYEMIFNSLTAIDALGTATSSGRGRFSKEDVVRIKNMILTRALSSDDKLFHHALYSWFINQNWIDQLFEIQSPYLEQYLLAGKSDLKVADYLARYYVRKNRFFEAAQLLLEVAHYPGLDLDQRLRFLTNALTNARSSSGLNSQEILSQLTDELDVARVQSDIIVALKSIPNTENDIEELSVELLDIGVLFSKYARVHNLYEIMLQIFFISDHSGDRSQAIIEHCWEEIFKLASKGAFDNSRPTFDAVADKVRELGRKFYPDESVFPLKYLISKLEFLGFQNHVQGSSLGWVAQTMLSIKVPYAVLFQVYNDLFEAKLPPWSSAPSIAHLIQNIAFIIENWFEHIRSPSAGIFERDEFPAQLVDESLGKYLISLPVTSKQLMNRLQAIQSRMRATF